MYQNPALLQALVRSRAADLRQSAGAGVRARPRKGRPRIFDAARHGAGWLLVDMGLRLAVSRGALNHPVARARR